MGEGNVFTSVCLFTLGSPTWAPSRGGGGGLTWAPSLEVSYLRSFLTLNSWDQTPTHPRLDTSPPDQTHPLDGYCRGRYASYWNAYLLHFFCHCDFATDLITSHHKVIHSILLGDLSWEILHIYQNLGLRKFYFSSRTVHLNEFFLHEYCHVYGLDGYMSGLPRLRDNRKFGSPFSLMFLHREFTTNTRKI